MGCKPSKEEKTDPAAEATDPAAADAKADESKPDSAKVIVVFGATGAQGGSVVRAMLSDDKYTLKAITRNPDSDKAKALAEKGVTIVKADLDDRDSIKAALEGAHGVFLVTNVWEYMKADKEISQGKTVGDVAKECGVQHLVFSARDDIKEAVGKDSDQFDTSATVEKYLKEQGLPLTIVRYATYYESFLHISKPKKNDSEEYVIDLPMGDAAFDMVCVADTGECIHQIFDQPTEYVGKTVGLSSQRFKVEEYAAILSKAFDDKKFVAGTIKVEDFAKLDLPGAAEKAILFEFFASGKCERDIELTRKLNPSIATFEQWVDNNKEAIEDAVK